MKYLKDKKVVQLKNMADNFELLSNQDLGKIKGGLVGIFIIGA